MLGDDRAAVPGRTSSGVRVTTDPDQQVADDLDFDRSHPSTAAVGLVGPLDQSAGDDLFGEVADTIPVQTGVRALLSGSGVREERLPILEVICDRVVRSLSTNLWHLTSRVFDVRLAAIESARFGEQITRFALPALFGVFRVPEWNNGGVIVADTGLGYMIVDAMLGGANADTPQAPTELRAFTSIETSLVARMMQLALSDLAEAFAPIAPIAMEFERVESNPRLASIASPGIGTVVCTFAIGTEGCVGKLAVLLPHTTLEPVRDKLVQRFIGESLGTDRLWEAHFEGEIRRTALKLQAVVAERTMSLRDVQSLQAGQLLRLDRSGNEPVALQAEGIRLAAGHLGQRNGRIAVRLLDPIGA